MNLKRFAIHLGTKFWFFRDFGAGSREQGLRKREEGRGKKENNPVYLIVMQTAVIVEESCFLKLA
ncbi:hypothetical protein BJP34_11545 [Moorena producens PAL-8-15-08-1]|uniref:Uncharacterized protein n=1 Tax=Moorena producens PAL-8-15-08-1 TaxID=1458985 RepID=A0A1D8TR05_9CYAN|nr:hypothetical protein BJP34_11545 [Moorena producens PAL-8-15-08-1]